jgi:hypothetical protein
LDGNKIKTNLIYTLTDITGREVMKGETSTAEVFSLNVQKLNPGIYHLLLQTNGGIIARQIAVN